MFVSQMITNAMKLKWYSVIFNYKSYILICLNFIVGQIPLAGVSHFFPFLPEGIINQTIKKQTIDSSLKYPDHWKILEIWVQNTHRFISLHLYRFLTHCSLNAFS